MLIEKSPVITATKDILAKCMATEDLRVVHRKEADTAYFDVENRVLCLPVWDNMSNSLYDMLVGHEVSHALHTPSEGWQEFVGDGKGSRMRHMFLNVVEDARIERLIKDKFPGLKRDFAAAYSELHERDLFELDGRTLDTDMPLIDRLNLHFKLGLFGHVTIPFADNEQQYITRMSNTVTFEDVIVLAKELYELQKELDEENQDESQASPESGDESGEDQDSDQDGDQDGSGEDQDSDQDGDQDGSGSSDDEQGEDSGQSQTDDTDDGESANSESGEGSESGEDQTALGYDDYSNETSTAGSTQNAFEKGVNDLRDKNAEDQNYHILPEMIVKNCVIDYKTVASIWEKYDTDLSINTGYAEACERKRIASLTNCDEFLNRTRSTVANMVQQFQMKQAADADKRTDIAKTGVLDTVNMINYRWSEDVFLKNEIHADGKNHGIVMYIDWSGSMYGIIKDTVEQLLILTEFCQKVNIPFDVYAFSSKNHPNRDNGQSVHNENREVLKPHGFSLIQFLSSDMKSNEYKQAVQKLYYLGSELNGYGGYVPSEFGMGCTPLNEAIMCAFTQVPAFQEKHGVQIVNTVFLTDGDGHSMGASAPWRGEKSFIHDPITRKDYPISKETDTYLQILQERTGTNLIGIRLYEGRTVRNLQYKYFNGEDMTDAAKSWKQHNFVAVDGYGYDKLFIVRGNLQVETDALDELDADASYTKLKNAFMKGSNNQKSSRVIASQLVDIIAN